MNKDKKAQVEIVGLLVIVILVTTIILLVIVFGISRPSKPTTTQQVQDIQLATLLFPTLLETTTDCDRTVRELLGDCAYANEITCDGDTKTSCEYANETIQLILEETLDVYGYDYTVKVYKPSPERELTKIESGGCGVGRNSIQKQNPFPTQFDYQPVIWSVKICSKKK